jgi:hypothetical protein
MSLSQSAAAPMVPMGVQVELWAAATDESGPSLLSEGPWRSPLLSARSEPHVMVETMLTDKQVPKDLRAVIHSTSWRVEAGDDGLNVLVVTYLAVVNLAKGSTYVFEDWPDAVPVGLETLQQYGNPAAHSPTEPPAPRYIDVLHHAFRHLAYLRNNDEKVRRALSAAWLKCLRPLEPALAVMYDPMKRDVA